MCGFIAAYSRTGSVLPERLQAGAETLDHRGPNSKGYWVHPERRVGMGHARLSIIDLETGNQPLLSPDGALACVVNGEFYDFERIREGLLARGHTLKTKSDSEILLPLYRERGAGCLEELRGEFALVLWDDANQTLFAARDRFGIKPLFYAEHEGTLYFASEVKALAAAGVPLRWDEESLFEIHAGGVFLPTRTLFKNIYQVPPGHYVVASRGHTRVCPYWDFDYPAVDARGDERAVAEHVETFRAKLHEAVKLRLRADVPVGCYLSGGIDSCSILGIASQYASRPLHAYTLSFADREYDERDIAEEMARKAGAKFTPVPVTQKDMADHYADAIWHAESIFINPHVVARYLLSRAVRDDGHRVVLSGEGSDEITGGYAHFRQDMILHNSQGQDPAEVQRLLKQLHDANQVSKGFLLGAENDAVPTLKNALGFVPSFLGSRALSGEKSKMLFHPDFFAKFETADPFRILLNEFDVNRQLRGREPVHQSLYLWSKTVLPQYNLSSLGDRMEMAHSIEGRTPFLDHHLVEAAVKMPVSMKIRGTTEKFVLREAAKDVLTDTLYRRQKHPFLAPTIAASDEGGPLRDLMQDTLRSEKMKSIPCYNHEMVIGLLDYYIPSLDASQRAALDPLLNMMMSFAFMAEKLHVS